MLENFVFEKIELKDLPIINSFVSNFDPYSDFNPISLICWNSNKNNMYSIKDDALVIKIGDYLNDQIVHSVLGRGIKKDALLKLLSLPEEVKMVPEISLQDIDENFVIVEDRDSFDYVIDLHSFKELKGKSYKALRKRVKAFEKKNKEIKINILDIKDGNIQKQIWDLTTKWSENKGFSSEKSREEVDGVEQYLKASDYFSCINIGLYISEKLVGYSFSQMLNNNWAMGHFGKADIDHEDSSLYLEYKADKLLYDAGARYLNLQQDTGLVGLRQTKMSYRPLKFLKKYTFLKTGII